LKKIEQIKIEAQKKHDEINKGTKEATDKVIEGAAKGIMGLDKWKVRAWSALKWNS